MCQFPDGADVQLKIRVGDFSSVLLGVLPPSRPLEYGEAELREAYLRAALEQAFASEDALQCTTLF
jgi:hypothetical protein